MELEFAGVEVIYASVGQTLLCQGITWGILLKCRFCFPGSGLGPEILHGPNAQEMLMLLVCGPHFEQQVLYLHAFSLFPFFKLN